MTNWGEWAPPPPPETQQYAGVVPPQGDAAIICPHCQTQGSVTTKLVEVKKGISGGKAAGAVLTAGFSVFATGLSRKEQIVELRCGTCRMVWRSA